MNKIKEYFKKNVRLFLYILIFSILVFIYNQNHQTINFVLKRGTVLEYGFITDSVIDKNQIKNKLSELNIKYTYIDELEESELYENEKYKKIFLIALPILARNDKETVFNEISDYVFENYKDSQLIDVKSLNYNYNEPYNAFMIFLGILFTSFIIWLILMYLIYDIKTINQKIKENIKSYFETRKENFKKLVEKTKEKGVLYLIKRILSDEKDDEKETSITYEVVSTVVFVIVCVIIIRFFIGELRWIPSGSMQSTINIRDRVFVEKLEYPKKSIERGDILVFYPPTTTLSDSFIAKFARLSGIFCKDIAFIKRVIGLPGEKFEIKQDSETKEFKVFINDEPLFEPYTSCFSDRIAHNYPYSNADWTQCSADMHCGPFIIPENKYFMMGDNRCNSADSRFWGFLDKERIIGRANFMFWPVKRINVLRDKYLNLHKEKTQDGYKTNKYILNRYEFL